MKRCISDARATDVRLLKCMASLPAEAFYESLGFRRTGLTEFSLPGGIRLAAILMERKIARR
jgi:hypothetical protein